MSFSQLTTGNLCWHAAQHADTLPNKIKVILTTIHICKTLILMITLLSKTTN